MNQATNVPSRSSLWLRSVLFWLVFLVSTLVLAFPVIFSAFVSIEVAGSLVRFWVAINLWSLKHICGLSYRVEGQAHIPDEPVIVFSKHQSTWETLFFQYQFPGILYVAKRELAWLPFFGWCLVALRYIFIDRSSGRKAIKHISDQYQQRKSEGLSLVIFPEGTRKPVGAEPDYKIGGAVVAVETDTPLLPVALNAGEFWPRHSFIKWPGEISIVFGPPIEPAGKTADQLRAEARDWIEGKMQEITVIDRYPY